MQIFSSPYLDSPLFRQPTGFPLYGSLFCQPAVLEGGGGKRDPQGNPPFLGPILKRRAIGARTWDKTLVPRLSVGLGSGHVVGKQVLHVC